MARSEEALRKRAAKRSVPLEVQKLKDGHRKSIRPPSKSAVSITVPKLSSPPNTFPVVNSRINISTTQPEMPPRRFSANPIMRDQLRWICLKCKNSNFPERELCNRCMEPKVSEATEPSPDDTESVPSKTKQCVSREKSLGSCGGEKPKQGTDIIQNATSRTWPSQAADAVVKTNARLRDLLRIERETGDMSTLTHEERQRAEVLLQRSERKKQKKIATKNIKKKRFQAKTKLNNAQS